MINSENYDNVAAAEQNLQRKLDWISRYDTRIAFTAGVAIAMLGVLANVASGIAIWDWYHYLVFGLTLAFLFISLLYVYLSQYPKTISPNLSLIYFGTIAKMSFEEFKDKFIGATKDDYLNDLLSQTYINADILDKKFRHLKCSLFFIGLSLLPWLLAIYFSKFYFR